MESLPAWIALNAVHGVGPVVFERLMAHAGSAAAVFNATAQDLAQVDGVSLELAQRIQACDWQPLAQTQLEACARCGCRALGLFDPEYPALLKAIPYAPPVLYVKGSLAAADTRALAVVGSRKATTYGLAATRHLVAGLVAEGLTIVSGLALGIDAEAHRAALTAGGRTLAVLGHGLDRVYPPQNRSLLERVLEHGAALSEFAPGVGPQAHHFPRRNRLISGLALGVLVVEAGPTSGSLISARWAGEQGREVFAVPGPYAARASAGTHALIQDGAKLVTRMEDILNELKLRSAPASRGPVVSPELSESEAALHAALAEGPLHVDQLVERSHRPVALVLMDLLTLELKGLAVPGPGQIYHRAEAGERSV